MDSANTGRSGETLFTEGMNPQKDCRAELQKENQYLREQIYNLKQLLTSKESEVCRLRKQIEQLQTPAEQAGEECETSAGERSGVEKFLNSDVDEVISALEDRLDLSWCEQVDIEQPSAVESESTDTGTHQLYPESSKCSLTAYSLAVETKPSEQAATPAHQISEPDKSNDASFVNCTESTTMLRDSAYIGDVELSVTESILEYLREELARVKLRDAAVIEELQRRIAYQSELLEQRDETCRNLIQDVVEANNTIHELEHKVLQGSCANEDHLSAYFDLECDKLSLQHRVDALMAENKSIREQFSKTMDKLQGDQLSNLELLNENDLFIYKMQAAEKCLPSSSSQPTSNAPSSRKRGRRFTFNSGVQALATIKTSLKELKNHSTFQSSNLRDTA